jgi:hypothetical protein
MIMGLIHTATVQKRNRKQKFTYTGGTGTPVVGQTLTGATSHKTAVVDKVATGYVVVKTLSGAFTTTETISTATLTGATLSVQADYKNQSGEYEYYWTDNQTSVPCRFYHQGGKGVVNHETGQLLDLPLKCAFEPGVTISSLEYRLVSTNTGFIGTYDIQSLYVRSGLSGIDHYEAVVTVVS